MALPFPADRVPLPVERVEVVPWQDDSDADLAGAIGGAFIVAGGTDDSSYASGIGYIVFPTAEDAERRLTENIDEATANGAEITAVEDAPYPTRRIVYDGYVIAVTRIDYVLITGFSVMATSDPAAASDDAIALGRAGVEHLLRLASVDATPAASPVP